MIPHLHPHAGDCEHACCLKIEHLSVHIGGETILDNIDLHMHCGQMVALIGPNGAGKSTLIRAILGQREYEGKITFHEASGKEAKLRIGYVPQSPAFDRGDPVSVMDLFTCCIFKRPAFLRPTKAMREKVLACLANVHGEALIDKRIGTLSGGELQRVLLALALEPMPNILILDEPLSGVDVEGMSLLMDMLDEIRKKFDLSILMTTHDFTMLEQYCDQVVLLQGKILRRGTPLAVLLLGPLFGLLSTMIVTGKMSFFSDALGHSGFTGIAIGVLCGAVQPIYFAVGLSVLFALLFSFVRSRTSQSADTIIGVFSSTAVALGIFIVTLGGASAAGLLARRGDEAQ